MLNIIVYMKAKRKKEPKKRRKNSNKFIQYRTHHEIHMGHGPDEDLGIVLGILGFVVGVWWGIVHLVDMFFNKLVWWQEPLTIIPVLLVVVPTAMIVEIYGKNPLHWWPLCWGTKVGIPEREPFRAYDEQLEMLLKEYGPTRVYVLDYTTLKFRTKKDAVMFSLKNLS